MGKKLNLLKVTGIITAIIIILLFLDYTLEVFIEGWNNPK